MMQAAQKVADAIKKERQRGFDKFSADVNEFLCKENERLAKKASKPRTLAQAKGVFSRVFHRDRYGNAMEIFGKVQDRGDSILVASVIGGGKLVFDSFKKSTCTIETRA